MLGPQFLGRMIPGVPGPADFIQGLPGAPQAGSIQGLPGLPGDFGGAMMPFGDMPPPLPTQAPNFGDPMQPITDAPFAPSTPYLDQAFLQSIADRPGSDEQYANAIPQMDPSNRRAASFLPISSGLPELPAITPPDQLRARGNLMPSQSNRSFGDLPPVDMPLGTGKSQQALPTQGFRAPDVSMADIGAAGRFLESMMPQPTQDTAVDPKTLSRLWRTNPGLAASIVNESQRIKTASQESALDRELRMSEGAANRQESAADRAQRGADNKADREANLDIAGANKQAKSEEASMDTQERLAINNLEQVQKNRDIGLASDDDVAEAEARVRAVRSGAPPASPNGFKSVLNKTAPVVASKASTRTVDDVGKALDRIASAYMKEYDADPDAAAMLNSHLERYVGLDTYTKFLDSIKDVDPSNVKRQRWRRLLGLPRGRSANPKARPELLTPPPKNIMPKEQLGRGEFAPWML